MTLEPYRLLNSFRVSNPEKKFGERKAFKKDLQGFGNLAGQLKKKNPFKNEIFEGVLRLILIPNYRRIYFDLLLGLNSVKGLEP
ncbi:hypothetical protein HC174_11920 [Salinimicrobium sp. CDJ15-81-2]|nr:hypothetical protein [Salinimicrobium nanhaiense]